MFKITNTNGFDFSARFDGKEYAFPSNETRMCPDDAAEHIFGLRDRNKVPIISRHAWAKPTDPVDVGLAVLNKFKFARVEIQYEAPLASEGRGPAPTVSGGAPETDGESAPPSSRRDNPLARRAAQIAAQNMPAPTA